MEAYGRRAARWGCKISSHTRRAMRVNFVVCRIKVWRFLASSLARPSLRVKGDRPWTSWRVMWPRGPESWTRREIRHNVRCHLAANRKRLPFFTSFQCSGILQLLCINLHHRVKRWSEVCNITSRPRNDWVLSEWASSTSNPLRQRRHQDSLMDPFNRMKVSTGGGEIHECAPQWWWWEEWSRGWKLKLEQLDATSTLWTKKFAKRSVNDNCWKAERLDQYWLGSQPWGVSLQRATKEKKSWPVKIAAALPGPLWS